MLSYNLDTYKSVLALLERQSQLVRHYKEIQEPVQKRDKSIAPAACVCSNNVSSSQTMDSRLAFARKLYH